MDRALHLARGVARGIRQKGHRSESVSSVTSGTEPSPGAGSRGVGASAGGAPAGAGAAAAGSVGVAGAAAGAASAAKTAVDKGTGHIAEVSSGVAPSAPPSTSPPPTRPPRPKGSHQPVGDCPMPAGALWVGRNVCSRAGVRCAS